jgi:hypothetical protein
MIPLPLVGEGGAHCASNGRERGLATIADKGSAGFRGKD